MPPTQPIEWSPIENLSNELRIVLAAARAGREATHFQDKLGGKWSETLDWGIVVAFAQRQGLVPQLCSWLETMASAPAVLSDLQKKRQQLSRR